VRNLPVHFLILPSNSGTSASFSLLRVIWPARWEVGGARAGVAWRSKRAQKASKRCARLPKSDLTSPVQIGSCASLSLTRACSLVKRLGGQAFRSGAKRQAFRSGAKRQQVICSDGAQLARELHYSPVQIGEKRDCVAPRLFLALPDGKSAGTGQRPRG
jgi:hypothetical protein